MTIERRHSGPRMSQINIHNGIVYLAGQVGSGDDVTAQTRDVLAKVDALLAEAGTGKSNILQATVWLADIGDFAAMNAVWDAWIDPANPPARACGEVKLARPDLRVEVIVVAAQ
ncbi:MAG: RidA family protein [Candidatus Competibacterales bacterium]